VVDYCDGWLPIPVRAGDLAAEIKDLRQRAAKAGRDPKSIAIATYGGPRDEAVVQQYRDAGVDHYIFGLPPAGPDKVLQLLDRYADFVRKV
jgi:alkanesulfonate monooxygenase SsuD/methylene tetrahydromethanopterin reductase-like flavin-dependent oxidoreductase (luciferase family)